MLYNDAVLIYCKGQSWGFTSRSTARVILGQVLRIATCGTRTHAKIVYNKLFNCITLLGGGGGGGGGGGKVGIFICYLDV